MMLLLILVVGCISKSSVVSCVLFRHALHRCVKCVGICTWSVSDGGYYDEKNAEINSLL